MKRFLISSVFVFLFLTACEEEGNYQCGTKTTCSQMTSCEEAEYYLNCGESGLDADGDGVPCESLCQ